jgi:hypothetical protein
MADPVSGEVKKRVHAIYPILRYDWIGRTETTQRSSQIAIDLAMAKPLKFWGARVIGVGAMIQAMRRVGRSRAAGTP